MRLVKMIVNIGFVFLILSELSFAGGLDGFMKFARSGSALTSVNAGAIVEDQRSGFMTGGSILRRGPRPKELQPVNIQMPSISFDPCTGSGDLRFGGLSYIKGSEFASYFKALASSSGAYVAKMAIKQACPQCEDIISYLETVTRDINGVSFGQCEKAKQIADGLMGRFNSATSQKCMAKSALSKGASDLYESTTKCQADPDRYGEKGDNAELKSMLPDNYNLVWKALSHGSGGEVGMKELLMSIAGSIIGKKQGGVASISSLPSLIEKEDLLENYIGKPGIGVSMIKIYKCDEEHKCLNPKIIEEKIGSSKDTLFGKVHSTIESIIKKVMENKGELSDEEAALIEYSRIPLISLLEIEIAQKDKESVMSLINNNQFIELVCYDMVTHFMQKMLFEARSAVDELATSQVDNTPIERFNRNIERVQELLAEKNIHAMRNLQTIISIKERLNGQLAVFQMGFTRFR